MDTSDAKSNKATHDLRCKGPALWQPGGDRPAFAPLPDREDRGNSAPGLLSNI